jgi:hypothetical protein
MIAKNARKLFDLSLGIAASSVHMELCRVHPGNMAIVLNKKAPSREGGRSSISNLI